MNTRLIKLTNQVIFLTIQMRADRRLSLGGRNLTIWFEAQNVYDRDNVFQYLWDTKANELRSIPQIRAKEQA